jgi:hypothetical protein
MAAIIEFYTEELPRSPCPDSVVAMREGASVPSRTSREHTIASSAFANTTDSVRQRDRTDKTSSEGDHFPTARNFELQLVKAKES